MSIRVHELAKELGLPSKDLVAKLIKLHVPVKGPMTVLDTDAIVKVRHLISRTGGPPKPKPVATKPAAKAKASAGTAVAAAPRKPAKTTAKAAPKTKAAPVKAAPATAAVRKSAAPAPKPAASAAKTAAAPATKPVMPAPAGRRTASSGTPVADHAFGVVPGSVAPLRPATAPLAPKQTPSIAPVVKAPAPPALSRPVAPVPPRAPAPAVAAPKRPEPPPAPPKRPEPAPLPDLPVWTGDLRPIQLAFPMTVRDFAAKLSIKPNDLIRQLMARKIFASLTQTLDQAVGTEVAKAFGYKVEEPPDIEESVFDAIAPDPAKLKPRAPVVTFMGHVDHGKTSLLDAIRKTKVTEGEAGGITQHIGAYEVILPKGRVTFLDTPGHEAFTALRARGANVTDVVVLVVAADDGVMPQTLEAIDHAKAAEVTLVVAINKMDKPEAKPDRVKQQLAEHGLQAEDWGGKTIMVPVSARTGEGIDQLLEMLLLEAELLELKADSTKPAQGVVLDAKLMKDRGAVATLLVQQGTLRVGDLIAVGTLTGRVRAMTNDRGARVETVLPASPVEILGLPGVPKAGDRFLVMDDERAARALAETRQIRQSQQAMMPPRHVTLEDLHKQVAAGIIKELKIILKADVQGSAEAIVQSLAKIDTKEVKLNVIHSGVGDISESDVMLAAASDAVVIGFHVGVDPKVQVAAVAEGVDIRVYQIIYEVVSSIKAAIEGLLEPTLEETFLGRAEVLRLFQISKSGTVAGCRVVKGTIRRDAVIRLIRGKERLRETTISNLKRLKDDVREVNEGIECGISLQDGTDVQAGDLIEAWEVKKVARKLG